MRTHTVRRALGGTLVTAATAAALLSAPVQAGAAPTGEQAIPVDHRDLPVRRQQHRRASPLRCRHQLRHLPHPDHR